MKFPLRNAALFVAILSTSAVAGEGFVSPVKDNAAQNKQTTTLTAETPRANYQDGFAADLSGLAGKSAGGVLYRDQAKVREADRPADMPLAQHKAYAFRLWDAGRTLMRDVDGDGYHREFKIRFDADVSSGSALVYAKLYLRRVGDNGSWKHYYTTNDFWINGESDSDDYFVETVLNDGFATADYDVLIDLYESGYSGIVATLGPFEDSSLRDLPLEDVGLDVPVANQGYHINAVSTELLIDSDRDGYYSKFRVTFDPDRDFGAGMVYAIMWVRAPGGEWIKERTTSVFQVDESGTADEYSITADWISGYDTARYDVQIDLYDAGSNLMVATVGSERPEFSRVPLEDANKDRYSNGGDNGDGGDSDSDGYGGGGGSWGLFSSLLMGLLWWRRR